MCDQPRDVGCVLWGRGAVGRAGPTACGRAAVGARDDVAVLAGRVQALQRGRQPRCARPQELRILYNTPSILLFIKKDDPAMAFLRQPEHQSYVQKQVSGETHDGDGVEGRRGQLLEQAAAAAAAAGGTAA